MEFTEKEKIFLGLSIISFIIVLFFFPSSAKTFLTWYLIIAVIFLTWNWNRIKPMEKDKK